MNAAIATVESLLHGSSVFRIPHFQRSYSWGEKQWDRLWTDLLALNSDKSNRKHFLGPLVCTPVPTVAGANLTQYVVIDGQQRLTTLSVLFGAIRDAAFDHSEADLAAQVTEDYLLHHRRRDALRFKLVPRTADHMMWQQMVERLSNPITDESAIDDAWRWFHLRVQSLVHRDGIGALRDLLHNASQRFAFVSITIDDENPYRVFESLNSTGLALSEFDLVRNHLFMQVPLDEQKRFDEQVWQPFERLWDDCRRSEGNAAKEATAVIRHFVMRHVGHFKKGETFMRFREWLDGARLTPAQAVVELTSAAKVARRFREICVIRDNRHEGKDNSHWPHDEIDRRLMQLSYCDAGTAMPLLIELFSRHAGGRLAKPELTDCLGYLVSLLIRRAIVEESTRQYDRKFVEIAIRLGESTCESLQHALHLFGWPSDQSIADALRSFPFYKSEPRKARLVLEEIERDRDHREAVQLGTMQVEHVMPQKLSGEAGAVWKKTLGENHRQMHQQLVHTLGNLTLSGYNQRLSNRRFRDKLKDLRKSNLELNREIAEMATWTGDVIAQRTVSLTKQFQRIFPVIGEPPPLETIEGSVRGERTDSNRTFWQLLLDRLCVEQPEIKPGSLHGRTNKAISGGHSCLRYVLFRNRSEVGVRAVFRGANGQRAFGFIRAARADIEREVGAPMSEAAGQKSWAGQFRISRQRLPDASPAAVDAEIQWLIKHMLSMRRVIEPRIAELGLAAARELSAVERMRVAWFTELLAYARTRTSLHASTSASVNSWVRRAAGGGHTGYEYWVFKNYSRVEFELNGRRSDPTLSKRQFDELLKHRSQIEAVTGPLKWERLPNHRASRIGIRMPGGLDTPRDEWAALHQRMVDVMLKFQEAFQPIVESGVLEQV